MPRRLEDVPEASRLYNTKQWTHDNSMVPVQLAKLKDETRCPICYGKIRNARVSMACLHRYCATCIEQYLRAKAPGRSNSDARECPVCRAHLHSRRATKPDPTFDRIIMGLYGDVDKFDAEEDALVEQDNKERAVVWQEQMTKMREAAAQHTANAAPLARIKPSADQLTGGSGRGRGRGRGRGSGGGGRGSGGGRGKRPREPDSTDAASADADLLLSLAPNGKRRKFGQNERSLSAIMADAPSVGPGSAGGRGRGRSKGGRGGGRGGRGGGNVAAVDKVVIKKAAAAAGKARWRPGASGQTAREEAKELMAEAAATAAAAEQQPRCYFVQLWPAGHPALAGTAAGAAGSGGSDGSQPEPQDFEQLAKQEAAEEHVPETSQRAGASAAAAPLLPPYLVCPGTVSIGAMRQLLQRRAAVRQVAVKVAEGETGAGPSDLGGAAIGGGSSRLSSSAGHIQLVLADAAHAARHGGGGAGAAADGTPAPLADAVTVSALWSSLPDPLTDVMLSFHLPAGLPAEANGSGGDGNGQ